MSLALMPGSEPIAAQVPEPTPSEDWLSGVGGAAPGCGCEHCNQLRSRFHEQARFQAMTLPPRGQRADVWVVDEASGYPQGMSPGMIRGRYDMSQSGNPNDGFHGQVRWRMPDTREVYDLEGRRQWTYEEELPDGTLVDRQNRRWVPDSARQDMYAGIATAMQQVIAAPPAFDWGTYDPNAPFPQLSVTRRPT